MPNTSDSRSAAELLKAFSHDMEELLPARQANISQHLAVLRDAELVDYAQDGSLRCYYLSRPQLVEGMLALVGRGDPVVKRTPAEIQAACHAGSTHISPVLAAMGVPHNVGVGAIRFSLGRNTRRDEIEAVVDLLVDGLRDTRRASIPAVKEND